MSNNGTDTVRFIKNPHCNVVSTSNNDKMIILQKQVIVTLLKLDDINQKWKKKEEYKMKKIIASVLSVTLLISAMMGVASAQEVESYNVNVTTTANNAEVENPGVFEGIELPFNTYKQSYQRTTYWKFELDESAEVNFLFNAPTNKNFSAVVYNENGVYAYEEANEISEMSVYLDAGTYYVKTNVPSIGEDCIQIRIWK